MKKGWRPILDRFAYERKRNSPKILIEYCALRDEAGNYLGCLEASQSITEIQKITGQKWLLDLE